jgi:hypothetical protein
VVQVPALQASDCFISEKRDHADWTFARVGDLVGRDAVDRPRDMRAHRVRRARAFRRADHFLVLAIRPRRLDFEPLCKNTERLEAGGAAVIETVELER